MHPTTLCSFWRNFSGHFARLACNHSYGYAFRPIEQIDSLTDFIKYTPLSAFSCNIRASLDKYGSELNRADFKPEVYVFGELFRPGIGIRVNHESYRESVFACAYFRIAVMCGRYRYM